MTAGRWSSWSIQIPQFLIKAAIKAGSTAMTQRPRDRVPSGSMLALPEPRRPDRANPLTNFWWSLFWQHLHDLHALGFPWTDSRQGMLCWGFKGVQEEISSEEASTLEIRSVAFPLWQCTSPSHWLFKQDGHQDNPQPPYSPDVGPCVFWLSPKLRGCRYETIEDMKEAVRKVIDTFTQEDKYDRYIEIMQIDRLEQQYRYILFTPLHSGRIWHKVNF